MLDIGQLLWTEWVCRVAYAEANESVRRNLFASTAELEHLVIADLFETKKAIQRELLETNR